MSPTDSVQLDEGDLKMVIKIRTKANCPDQITTERIRTGKDGRTDRQTISQQPKFNINFAVNEWNKLDLSHKETAFFSSFK